MATTPESKVKARVRKALSDLKARGYPVYYHMPVQNGMGKPTLDFVGSINGKFFAIETKAPGKKATERQEDTIKEMQDAGGHVMVYDGTNPEVLAGWLAMLF
jgi:hypothetical protein